MSNWLSQNSQVRKAAFAGTFYPGTEPALKKQLNELIKETTIKARVKDLPRALIAPHAGYVFSGKVAAAAYNQIPEDANYKRVFVLATSHRYHFDGASVYTKGNYSTPLGQIETDVKTAEQLIRNSEWFQDKPELHENEHSLEVQLPFLQYKLKSFKLVPIIIGTNETKTCRKIAESLESYYTPENLFVISTDLSHYPGYSDAKEVDENTLEAITKNSVKTLLQVLDKNSSKKIENLATSLCGWTSVVTLLHITENKEVIIKKIDYQNSGDAKRYGDKERVVGYGALAVFDKKDSFYITAEEKNKLLNTARESITQYLEKGKRETSAPDKQEGILGQEAGAFVSIYINKELRGCIGGFAQGKPLLELVKQMAVSAANDRRFDPVKKDELYKMKLEISVLSPLKKIDSIDEIELGKHGIYIKKGVFSGTFLPQVATKTGWDIIELLGRCSRDKAGLGWDGWKTADIFVYEAKIVKD